MEKLGFKILHIKKDMRSLEKGITKRIKEYPDIAKIKDVKQFHILDLEFKEDAILASENFKNHSFLYHLYPIRKDKFTRIGTLRKRDNHILTYSLITDSKGNLIAYGDILSLHPTSVTFLANFAKLFFDKEIDFAFSIYSALGMPYFIGIKGNNLYAFGWDYDINDFVKYTWEEFIECCFDDWINSRKRKGKK